MLCVEYNPQVSEDPELSPDGWEVVRYDGHRRQVIDWYADRFAAAAAAAELVDNEGE